jgi:hypothetical protein
MGFIDPSKIGDSGEDGQGVIAISKCGAMGKPTRPLSHFALIVAIEESIVAFLEKRRL